MTPTATDTKELQSQYWKAFMLYLKANPGMVGESNNIHNTWCNFPLGSSRGFLEAVVNTLGSCRVELRIKGDQAIETYRLLELRYEDDANQLFAHLIWDAMPDCALKRVYVETDADIYNQADWQRQFEWLRTRLEAFYLYFKPKLKML